MYLIYLDESGNTGINLNDPNQPLFVLAALVVSESLWMSLEKDLTDAMDNHFPLPRPLNFEIHATNIRNGSGYFRQFSVSERLAFRDDWLKIAHKHNLKLIYRAIAKRRLLTWIRQTFCSGVFINPHVAAFPLVSHVVDEYLDSLPGNNLGIFISDENREIISDVEKAIFLLRGGKGNLKLNHIIEKGFFIDSSKILGKRPGLRRLSFPFFP